jgi:hypothetical protein
MQGYLLKMLNALALSTAGMDLVHSSWFMDCPYNIRVLFYEL